MTKPPRNAAPPLTKPLRLRVEEDFLARIQSGQWPLGSTLPPEKDLIAQTRASRHAVRTALARLREQGLIETRQGAPSKVVSTQPPRVYSQDFNTLRDVLRYPGDTTRKNFCERYIECDTTLAPILRAPIGSSWFHIGAVRTDHQTRLAVAWTDIYIRSRFARITKLKNHLRAMVFEQIEEHFDVTISRVEFEIRADALPAETSALLDVPAESPCLLVIRRYFDQHGEAFETSVTYHVMDRFTFAMNLQSRNGTSGA